MELHPKKWFEVDSPKLLQQAIETVSAFLGTHPVDTYLVQNVTKGECYHRRLKFGPSILPKYLNKNIRELFLTNAEMAYSAHRGWTLEVA